MRVGRERLCRCSVYHYTVEPDAIDMPVTERLIGELATMLRNDGLVDTAPSPDERPE